MELASEGDQKHQKVYNTLLDIGSSPVGPITHSPLPVLSESFRKHSDQTLPTSSIGGCSLGSLIPPPMLYTWSAPEVTLFEYDKPRA